MEMKEIMEQTRAYVTENFLYMRPDVEIGAADSLLANGVIDSMGITELIAFVEDTFGITVADDEITEANFDSLHAIAAFVAGKFGPPGSGPDPEGPALSDAR